MLQNLQSTKMLLHYQVQTIDGEVGKIEDFLVTGKAQSAEFMVIETTAWLSGRIVLVPLRFVSAIDHEAKTLQVDLEQEAIANSPHYDPDTPLTQTQMKILLNHYVAQHALTYDFAP